MAKRVPARSAVLGVAEYYDPIAYDPGIVLNWLFQILQNNGEYCNTWKRLLEIARTQWRLAWTAPDGTYARGVTWEEIQGSERHKSLYADILAWMDDCHLCSPLVASRALMVVSQAAEIEDLCPGCTVSDDLFNKNPELRAYCVPPQAPLYGDSVTTDGSRLPAIDTPGLLTIRVDGGPPFAATPDGIDYGPGAIKRPRLSEEDCKFEFRDAGWNPQTGFWDLEEKRIKAAFRRYLREYERRMRGTADSRGLKKTPTKTMMAEHCEWLLYYQNQPGIYEECAQHFHVDRVHYMRAVQEIADALGVMYEKKPRRKRGRGARRGVMPR